MWTREAPKIPGYYWTYCEEHHIEPTVTCVFLTDSFGKSKLYADFQYEHDWVDMSDVREMPKGLLWWSEAIPLPPKSPGEQP